MEYLNDKSTNSDFLTFVTDYIHNVVASSVDKNNHPYAQVCDALYHKDDKLYLLAKKDGALYDCIKHAPEIKITASKGDGTMNSVGIGISGMAYDVEHKYQAEIFEKNPYLNQIYAGHLEEAKEYMHTIEVEIESGSIYDIRLNPIYRRTFKF